MKVLILGAKGILGQELVRVFGDGNEVIGWDRDEIDITEKAECRLQIANLKPDLVINAAAYTNVDGAESEPEVANAVNGYAVGYLAAACRELDILIVHYSTDYVFDGTKKEGYVESDLPNPISKYGQSKFLGEQELQKNTEKFYLIRLSRLFGKETPSPYPLPRGERGKGEGEPGGKKSFVTLMLELAKTKNEIEVVDEEVSCPTYAPDLAKLTKYLIDNHLPFGIYHGTNAGSATWYEFAQKIFKIAQVNVKLMPVSATRFPRPTKRPQYGVLLNTKLPPMRSWQSALEEFLKLDLSLDPSPAPGEGKREGNPLPK